MTRIPDETRRKDVRAYIRDGRTMATLWLSTAYPESLFPTSLLPQSLYNIAANPGFLKA